MEQETGGRQIKYLKKKTEIRRKSFKNGLKGVLLITWENSSTSTQSILAKLIGKGTSKITNKNTIRGITPNDNWKQSE